MTRLRPPSADDLDDVFRIHGDPRTNLHNPAGPDRDLDASGARLAEWLEHWDRHGFGYWVVEDDDGAVIGFSGVRHEIWQGRPVLNLYYRFAPEVWGRGLASSVAAHAVRCDPSLSSVVYAITGRSGWCSAAHLTACAATADAIPRPHTSGANRS